MDENQKENVGNDIKQETVNTFNEAKEKMKNIDFKAEAIYYIICFALSFLEINL